MAFHVGQKVVCADAADTNIWDEAELTEGGIYTIAAITGREGAACWNKSHAQTEIGFRLVEVTRRTSTPFAATRFRPLIERKTDISIFTEMLKPKTRELVGCGND